MEPEIPVEKPLSGRAKLLLIAGSGGAILLFYLLTLVTVLTLSVVVAFEFILAVALSRVGLAVVMARVLGRHLSLLTTIVRSFWLRKGAEFRIPVRPEEAPGLFALIEMLCARIQLAPPGEISVEMNANAWVHLRGFRQGTGRTILAIGFDLLAGLSEAEVKAVLAHELAHAKLIRRGFRRWLSFGLARCSALTSALFERAEAGRRAQHAFEFAGPLLAVNDRLTRLSARLFARYSRQDEFEADRGAAELCGSRLFRSALVKVEALAGIAARVPLRERVAQLQLDEGFSRWLVRELAGAAAPRMSGPGDETMEAHNKYSTHPRLRDRLAALPPDTMAPPGESESAIWLLADPDAVASRLVREIERVLAEQELKDSQALGRLTRKARAGAAIRPLQWAAIVLFAIGGIVGLFFFATARESGGLFGWLAAVLIFIGSGAALFRWGHYRDRRELPVPDFSVLKAGWQGAKLAGDLAAAEKSIETEIRTRLAATRGRRKKAELLIADSYAALGKCEYLRAHVASRLCLEIKSRSVEGHVGLAIASAALGQPQQAQRSLGILQQTTGLRTPAVAWAGAWTLLLMGHWDLAEALLDVALKRRPGDPTWLTLLALARSRRGKLQSAVASAREACTPRPKNREHAKVLINLLLDGGYVREAHERLAGLEAEAKNDPELMLAMVRLHLLRRDPAASDPWAACLTDGSPRAPMLIRLADAYEAAMQADRAGLHYRRALDLDYYPEACLGLARLAAQRGDKAEAQRLAMTALDLTQPVGEDGIGPLALFQRTLIQLLQLEIPVPNCRAWIARFGPQAQPAVLAHQAVMVFAPALAEAQQALSIVIKAMQPGMPPQEVASLHWREAPRLQQPDGPVRPGVQGVGSWA